jgi:hypothetical protein
MYKGKKALSQKLENKKKAKKNLTCKIYQKKNHENSICTCHLIKKLFLPVIKIKKNKDYFILV